MNRILSLPGHAWMRARMTHPLRTRDSVRRLEHVVAIADLPPEELADAHRRLAAGYLQQGRYSRARHQLRQAMRLISDCSTTLLQLAKAWEDDPQGRDRLAAIAYRRATKIDPRNAIAWASFGRACVRVQRDSLANKALAMAIRLAPADGQVLEIVTDALRESGRLNLALRLATRARFRNPSSAVIRAVMDRIRFEMARVRSGRPSSRTLAPHLLPFIRIVGTDGRTHTLRQDLASNPSPVSTLRLRRNA